jgi:transcriptional regulator with XRE-family HTH domain
VSTKAAYEKELAALLAQLAENVRRLREEKKPEFSQEEVADEATLHRTQWGKIETGKRDPRFSTLLVIADTLGVTLNELAEGIATPKERKPAPPTKRNRTRKP